MADYGLRFQKWKQENKIDEMISFLIYHWKDKTYHVNIFTSENKTDLENEYYFHDNDGFHVKITEEQFKKLKTEIPRLIQFKDPNRDVVQYLSSEQLLKLMYTKPVEIII